MTIWLVLSLQSNLGMGGTLFTIFGCYSFGSNQTGLPSPERRRRRNRLVHVRTSSSLLILNSVLGFDFTLFLACLVETGGSLPPLLVCISMGICSFMDSPYFHFLPFFALIAKVKKV